MAVEYDKLDVKKIIANACAVLKVSQDADYLEPHTSNFNVLSGRLLFGITGSSSSLNRPDRAGRGELIWPGLCIASLTVRKMTIRTKFMSLSTKQLQYICTWNLKER